MLRSLVGSVMCIRDRCITLIITVRLFEFYSMSKHINSKDIPEYLSHADGREPNAEAKDTSNIGDESCERHSLVPDYLGDMGCCYEDF